MAHIIPSFHVGGDEKTIHHGGRLRQDAHRRKNRIAVDTRGEVVAVVDVVAGHVPIALPREYRRVHRVHVGAANLREPCGAVFLDKRAERLLVFGEELVADRISPALYINGAPSSVPMKSTVSFVISCPVKSGGTLESIAGMPAAAQSAASPPTQKNDTSNFLMRTLYQMAVKSSIRLEICG